VTDHDPYTILGVTRAAGRDEIARAYHRLAKQHHPDAGAPPSPQMALINEAWYTLSDPARRARWDQGHGAVVAPAHWAPAPATRYAEPAARPMPRPTAPPSRLDSGWIAAAIVAGVVVVVGLVMVGVSIAAQPGDDRVRLDTPGLTLLHEPTWTVSIGDGEDSAENQVLAHLASWETDPNLLCTTYGEPCGIESNDIPPGEASILITAHEGGTPPVPEPVTNRPYGLDAEAMIGGKPAAYEETELEDGLTLYWWQLSPPGFPDRWIEIRALIHGFTGEMTGARDQIGEMLNTIEFRD
jgi:hypothetical protein